MEILSTFKKYNIRPSKKLAQNFLTDKNILEKIVEAADLNINDIVLEIGPGLGVLTNELSKRCKKIIAVEKDEKMLEVLKDRNYPNIELINKDILKTTIQLPEKYKLIANLPYYITSPIIRMFLEKDQPELMVLMIQKEVAQRICAKEKLSVLSVSVQFYADAKIIRYVSKNCFYPVPKVDSAIIKIIPKQIPNIDTEKFFKLVKMGFSSKRKKLKNNLKPIIKKEIDFDLNLRAEDLSVNDWIKLFNILDF